MKPVYTTIEVIDQPATAARATELLQTRKFTYAEIARKMNVSPPYVQMLCEGKRAWSEALVAKFSLACNAA